jgi:glycosyltransferase involved in cell wall biosynthesis
MKVVFFHRKPRPNYNFSVENLFNQIRQVFPPTVQWKVKELSFYSDGFFKRLFIGLEAAFNQSEINHVTGDINFLALFLRKKKTVLTILDTGFMSHPNRLARWVLKLFWIVLPVKCSRFVTTISKATKDEVLRYVKVDPAKIKVIYVPILSSFKFSPKAFNKSCPIILQLGTRENKNVMRLAEALSGIECQLEIIGEVEFDLRMQLEKFKINYVSSMNLSNEQVLEKYKFADIISFASTYEGFGMPIVEANTVGRVVITSNILSMPEVAGNGAHFVDPFDVYSIRQGILKVIEDDSYRDQLIANGLINSKRFEVKQIAQQYIDLYSEMVR